MEITTGGIAWAHHPQRRYDPALRRTIDRHVLLIPGQGCVPWLRTSGQCCPFCRLPAASRDAVLGPGHEGRSEAWPIDPSDHREMIETGLKSATGAEEVVAFNGGSWLTNREIPAAARIHLYDGMRNHLSATRLMVESRPEFIRASALDEAERHLGDTRLKVAIGLESTDDAVRNGNLRKFIGWRSFEEAIKRLHDRGMESFVYVFVGAPGLSPAAALEDAQRSVRRLADMGVTEIALSCAFVPPGGPLEKAFLSGTFRPPSLWTVVSLLEWVVAHGWPVSVGEFDDVPPPIAIAANCGNCDAAVHEVIENYRKTGKLEAGGSFGCDCRTRLDAAEPIRSVAT
ncbi:radical SAM enzyme (TIGR01210 family) [Roseovarius sp. MBR-79]